MTRTQLIFVAFLLGLFIAQLQWSLWGDKGMVWQFIGLKEDEGELAEKILNIKEGNQILRSEVADLKHYNEVVEEHAREELGMVREGEFFFRVVPQRQ